MGLSEAHQVLRLNRLRHSVKLRTDGGIKTGRDVGDRRHAGARKEFGIGTASLVAMGCIMVRQCHSNTAPGRACAPRTRSCGRSSPGNAGEGDQPVLLHRAEEVREILASPRLPAASRGRTSSGGRIC